MNDLFAEPQLEIAEPSTENKKYLELLRYLHAQFIDAKNLGSLIQVDSKYKSVLDNFRKLLEDKTRDTNPTTRVTSETLLPIVNQAILLANKYDVCVANPPYMGSKYQTPLVKTYLKDNFKGYEKDLFSAFIIRNLQLTREHGELGFMTPFVWMFISSYEELRSKLIKDDVISSLVQLEYSGFDGATVPICTFTITKGHINNYKGSYIRLSDFKGSANQGPKTLEAINNRDCGWFFEARPDDFNKIPGSPIAYWSSFHKAFNSKSISHKLTSGGRCKTHNDELYVRYNWEVSANSSTWIPYEKGGEYRKWYGNTISVVNWSSDAKQHYLSRGGITQEKFWNRHAITWSAITSSKNSFRLKRTDAQHSSGAPCLFSKNKAKDDEDVFFTLLGLCNSKVAEKLLSILSPTLNANPGDVVKLPMVNGCSEIAEIVKNCIKLAKDDWDENLTSIDFKYSPFLNNELTILKSFRKYMKTAKDRSATLLRLEQELNTYINQNFNSSLTGDINLDYSDITLTSMYNDASQLGDLVKDKLTYLTDFIVGCMMGRYSPDREGLVYAYAGNQGSKNL
ncbi:putative type II restriction enzyme methylase subunit [Vibrio sp. JCM 18905]|nr:putative type II restriction enzyme methylase subunit [Vibrio sp. JCM 18905]